MTAWVLAQDADALLRRAWETHGKTPDELLESLTPSQFVLLFARAKPAHLDRVEELKRHNDRRAAAGRPPAFPSWL